MNFKDLENAEIGTILVGNHGRERLFDGFNRKGDMIKTESVREGYCVSWEECEIANWKIKKPEFKPEKLGRLYMAARELHLGLWQQFVLDNELYKEW